MRRELHQALEELEEQLIAEVAKNSSEYFGRALSQDREQTTCSQHRVEYNSLAVHAERLRAATTGQAQG